MKANELTDGIYVYFNCFDGSKIIVKVTGFKDGVVYGVSKTGSHWCTIEKVEPIPITPEILEKNGFVCTQKADEMETAYECWSFHDGLLSIVFEPDVVMLEVHNGGENGDAVRTMTYYTDNDIMYLHELQHALILCKIEKKIEL